jgi:hypothetical protein
MCPFANATAILLLLLLWLLLLLLLLALLLLLLLVGLAVSPFVARRSCSLNAIASMLGCHAARGCRMQTILLIFPFVT